MGQNYIFFHLTKELRLNKCKDDFLNIWIFLHPQIPDFQIVVSRPNIVLSNHTSMERLFIQLSDDV